MAARKLVIFEHESPLGSVPSHELFDRIRIKRKDDSGPARDYGDYVLEIDDENLPLGVRLITKP